MLSNTDTLREKKIVCCEIAAEFVNLKVDVIVTAANATAAKNETKTIPIVFAAISDPVAIGIVDSLARPGGNITGLSVLAPELAGKRLELLKEAAPKTTRLAFLSLEIGAISERSRRAKQPHRRSGYGFDPWRLAVPTISIVHSLQQ